MYALICGEFIKRVTSIKIELSHVLENITLLKYILANKSRREIPSGNLSVL